MGLANFLNTPEDMQWLLHVHGIVAASAGVLGNEDSPTEVQAFPSTRPDWDTSRVVYRPDALGVLRAVPVPGVCRNYLGAMPPS